MLGVLIFGKRGIGLWDICGYRWLGKIYFIFFVFFILFVVFLEGLEDYRRLKKGFS